MERDKWLMINTSSPDRGLKRAVEIYKELKKEYPLLKMKWAYGFGVFDVVHSGNTELTPAIA